MKKAMAMAALAVLSIATALVLSGCMDINAITFLLNP